MAGSGRRSGTTVRMYSTCGSAIARNAVRRRKRRRGVDSAHAAENTEAVRVAQVSARFGCRSRAARGHVTLLLRRTVAAVARPVQQQGACERRKADLRPCRHRGGAAAAMRLRRRVTAAVRPAAAVVARRQARARARSRGAATARGCTQRRTRALSALGRKGLRRRRQALAHAARAPHATRHTPRASTRARKGGRRCARRHARASCPGCPARAASQRRLRAGVLSQAPSTAAARCVPHLPALPLLQLCVCTRVQPPLSGAAAPPANSPWRSRSRKPFFAACARFARPRSRRRSWSLPRSPRPRLRARHPPQAPWRCRPARTRHRCAAPRARTQAAPLRRCFVGLRSPLF
jgi:hypothetical protein